MRGRMYVAVSALLLLAPVQLALGQRDLRPISPEEWSPAAAAHLLRRAGFGGTPAEIEALYRLGLDGAVDRLTNFTGQSYDPPGPALPPIVLEPLAPRGGGADAAERRRRIEAERLAHRELRLWWLERMVESPRPLEEKMTLLWHGHFTSGAREVKRSSFMLRQNELLRRHALGSFRTLLAEISRDPAMLVYLDNARNTKRQPNENFARELLELFTLGEGNYTEADVKAAARAFTGWSLAPGGDFRFRPALHDAGEKTFLGKTGRWDGADILDIILEQPACSRFLARKLLTFFVEPDPPRRLVEALAVEIRRHDYELRPVLVKLFKSRAFYAPEARGALIKSPIELVVGTARTLGVTLADLPAAERALAALGQELMQPPNVRGWPGGPRWINTATLLQRYNVTAELVAGRAGRAAADVTVDEPADAMDGTSQPTTRSRGARRPQPACDPAKLLVDSGASSAEDVVDFLASRLLACPLPAEKRAALVDYLAAGASDWRRPASLPRLRETVQLLLSSPEYQLN